ncbi:MAG: transposase [Vulcanimicrobiota bacterium]
MENRSEELKNHLKADRTSCTSFLANQLRLSLHFCAYIRGRRKLQGAGAQSSGRHKTIQESLEDEGPLCLKAGTVALRCADQT